MSPCHCHCAGACHVSPCHCHCAGACHVSLPEAVEGWRPYFRRAAASSMLSSSKEVTSRVLQVFLLGVRMTHCTDESVYMMRRPIRFSSLRTCTPVIPSRKASSVLSPRFERNSHHLKGSCSVTSNSASSRWLSCCHASAFPILSITGICTACCNVIGFGATS